MYSCSNNNSNSSYAVHILGSYENGRNRVNTPVSISGYNFGIKPTILVLVSYKAVNWILDIPSGIVIQKVLLVCFIFNSLFILFVTITCNLLSGRYFDLARNYSL